MIYKKGHIPWNKGLSKECDNRVAESSRKNSETHKKMCKEGKLKMPCGPLTILKNKNPEKYKKYCENRSEIAKERCKNEPNFGFKKGCKPSTGFKKGHTPWNKDTHICTNTGKTQFKKGEHYSPNTEFKNGHKTWNTGLNKNIDTRLMNVSNECRKFRLTQKLPKKETNIEIALDVSFKKVNIVKNRDYKTNIPILNICIPDKVFEKEKIAVFCDGDYWHNIPKRKKQDAYQNKILQENGWKVLRFWEHDIKKDPDECALIVLEALQICT